MIHHLHLEAEGRQLVLAGRPIDDPELLGWADKIYRQVNCWFQCCPRKLEALAGKRGKPQGLHLVQ